MKTPAILSTSTVEAPSATLAALVTLPGDTTLTPVALVVAELAAYALAHRFVKDKSAKALSSRVAQKLNSRRTPPPRSEPYWTGPAVLAAFPAAFADCKAS